MTPDENKALVRHIYTELSQGNVAPLYAHLDEQIEWTIIGSTPLSGTYRGVEAVRSQLGAGLRAALTGPVQFTINRLTAEDDVVVLEADGRATTKTGRPYNNRYCIVSRITDGKLREITDYIDTELITNALFT
jgi:ketosteroid isomerase-like protein